VGLERGVGFFLDGIGQAVAAHHDHGVEVVGFSTVNFAFGGGQLNLRHNSIIGENYEISS
jgi:hypothetical protein